MYVLKGVLIAAGTEVVICDVDDEYKAQTFLSFAPPAIPKTRRYSPYSLEGRTLDENGIQVKFTFYHTDMQRNCALPFPSATF